MVRSSTTSNECKALPMSEAVMLAVDITPPTLPSGWWRKIRKKPQTGTTTTSLPPTLDVVTTSLAKERVPRNRTARCPPVPKFQAQLSKPTLDAVAFVRLNDKMPYDRVTHWLLWMHFAGRARVYLSCASAVTVHHEGNLFHINI